MNDFGLNKATDYFILKFLMCNQKTSDGLDPPTPVKEEPAKEVVEEEDEFTVSDAKTAKKYAVTSYLKLLTARVLRLEQEMARHKKVSVIMVGDKEKEEPKDDAEDEKKDEGGDADEANDKSPPKSPVKFQFFDQGREEEKTP